MISNIFLYRLRWSVTGNLKNAIYGWKQSKGQSPKLHGGPQNIWCCCCNMWSQSHADIEHDTQEHSIGISHHSLLQATNKVLMPSSAAEGILSTRGILIYADQGLTGFYTCERPLRTLGSITPLRICASIFAVAWEIRSEACLGTRSLGQLLFALCSPPNQQFSMHQSGMFGPDSGATPYSRHSSDWQATCWTVLLGHLLAKVVRRGLCYLLQSCAAQLEARLRS